LSRRESSLPVRGGSVLKGGGWGERSAAQIATSGLIAPDGVGSLRVDREFDFLAGQGIPMGNTNMQAQRPLSPHLQIYRPMLTMMMSIAHRVSGVGNAVGFILLTWWLVAISSGPEAYATVNDFFGSIFGRFLLFVFSWGLIHHMLGGIRHLIWDTGRGLDKVSIEIFAWGTIIGSTVLTVLVWIAGYWLRGGA
jgi:succinate dehydrogenase cytochrome b subunit